MVTNAEIRVGSIVQVGDFLDGSVRARVTAVLDDVKNGRPGFDGTVFGGSGDGDGLWRYTSQVTAVIEF